MAGTVRLTSFGQDEEVCLTHRAIVCQIFVNLVQLLFVLRNYYKLQVFIPSKHFFNF